MEKKKWIEEVLSTAQTLQRAEAPAGLWQKVEAKVKNETKVITLVPKRTIWLAAASIGVLVVLNWFALRSYRNPSERVSPVESLIEQYQLN